MTECHSNNGFWKTLQCGPKPMVFCSTHHWPQLGHQQHLLLLLSDPQVHLISAPSSHSTSLPWFQYHSGPYPSSPTKHHPWVTPYWCTLTITREGVHCLSSVLGADKWVTSLALTLLHFNVHVATIYELQSYLEDKLAALDVVSEALEDVATEAEDEKDADKGFPSHNEWIACPGCQTTTISLFYLLMKWMKQLKPLKLCINLNQTHLRLTIPNGRKAPTQTCHHCLWRQPKVSPVESGSGNYRHHRDQIPEFPCGLWGHWQIHWLAVCKELQTSDLKALQSDSSP